MRHRPWWVLSVALCLMAGRALAGEDALPLLPPLGWVEPISLSEADALAGRCRPLLADQDPGDNSDSVYAIPTVPREDEGINSGAGHVDLNVAYFNRYVYRGIDHDTVSRRGNALNLTVDARLTFDTGQWPHPFAGIFTDVYDSDPVSRFQEIRPYFGLSWNLRPLFLEAGDISYIYPNREGKDTDEVYGKVGLDDSLIFGTERPIFNSYLLAAYDYTHNHGWYFETGISHDIVFDELGLTVTPKADVAYIYQFPQNFVFVNNVKKTGWQHMDVGLDVSYSLNTLINISKRYGEFNLKGYIYYTARISQNISADNVVWGGGGIGFKY